MNDSSVDRKPCKFEVTITEISKMSVIVEANCREEAEQIVADKWYACKYVLNADNFCNVEFTAVEADDMKGEYLALQL